MTADPASPFIHRAAQRDAAGDHDEAINELARGVRAGDLPSTRALGLRLLTGSAAPLLPAQGLQLLCEAVQRGDAEAAARAAGVLALGINQPPDWHAALEWLVRSAGAGWEPSQRQLRALCGDAGGRCDAGPAEATDWAGLAASIDLAAWRRPAAGEVLNADPLVRSFCGFISTRLCAALIPYAIGRLHRARVYDPVRRADIIDAHRDNTQATFDAHSIEFAHALLQARIASACAVDPRQLEPVALLHYNPGEQIADHYDFVDPERTPDYANEVRRNGQRIITFLVYLNDDYEGGETHFPRLGLTHRGRAGDALMFVNALADLSPDKRTLHAGRPPSRGEKWIVSQFVRGRPARP